MVTTENGLASLHRYMSCLGRFADTHTAFITTMYGAGEIPQSFCRCCAVYGGVYVLRRTMRQLLVGEAPPMPESEPEPEPEPKPEPELEPDTRSVEPVPVPTSLSGSPHLRDDSAGYFHGIVCTAGQQLKGQYLVTGWEHLSALQPAVEKGDRVEVFARAVCIATSSLVDGMGTILSVMPPNSLLPDVANDCCVRLQQFDRNAKVAPPGEFIVHMSCSATVVADSHEVVAARELELQGFLKAAVRLLFASKDCSVVVNHGGEVSSAAAAAVPTPPTPGDDASKSKPDLLWVLFFNKAVRAEKPSKLPTNVFVAEETHWGDLDFDGATVQAKRIFEQMFPGEPFLPALPDPDAVQDDAALLLVRSVSRMFFALFSRKKRCCSQHTHSFSLTFSCV